MSCPPREAIWLTEDVIALPSRISEGAQKASLEEASDLLLVGRELTEAERALDRRTLHEPFTAFALTDVDGAKVARQRVEELLKGPLTLVLEGQDPAETGVQIGPVLDNLYGRAVEETLGVQWVDGEPTLRLWAPTALKVRLLVWPQQEAKQTLDAVRDDNGIWTVKGSRGWLDAEYLWEVTVFAPCVNKVVTNLVTDPYSVGLTVDSEKSVMVDLADPKWMPDDWGKNSPPALRNPAAQSIYELHVRDFSIWDDSVPEDQRGTYAAFTLSDSAGVNALKELRQAGLTTIHLLPTYDIASSVLPEKREQQKTPKVNGIPLKPQNLAELAAQVGWAADSALPANAVEAVIDEDGFNWGYEPYHWLTPEGSYATDANQNGGARTREYRQMVEALHGKGFRVVQDVVFNHTTGSGLGSMSVLDKIVPGYYHRLSSRGDLETSTCCANIATERLLAEKLMIDALVSAARDYKIDGFRFDLMGHHSLQNLKNVRAALDNLTVEADGVDGKDVYMYGEGWNFGEVANDALFVQARQEHIAGTGIGVFNDQFRDAVRGGSPMDEDQGLHQGFASGLHTDPNGQNANADQDEQEARLRADASVIRRGLAGDLRDFHPAGVAEGGYSSQPQETISYVEAHDNESLFDSNAWKLPRHASPETRLRSQVLANSLVALGQGPAFWTAGTELLRSKSLDRDSYNSGDWFNAIDWEGNWHQFGRGLPPRAPNAQAWPGMRPLLRTTGIRPDKQTIQRSKALHLDLLKLRSTLPLLTLGDAELIKRTVSFPDVEVGHEQAGVVVMLIDLSEEIDGKQVDPENRAALVVFNATRHRAELELTSLAGRGFQLSAVQEHGADDVVKSSFWGRKDGTVSVPPRTAAVFTERW